MASINEKITIGDIKLQNFAKPPLLAGKYTLEVKVNLANVKDKAGKEIEYKDGSLSFTVSAPRFSLAASDIYSVYPLAASSGAYHSTFPHIVFTRKTLPWERVIGTDADDQNPWLALLLLTDKEMSDNGVVISEMPIAEITPSLVPNVISPNIKIEKWEEKLGFAEIMHLPLSLFKEIAPFPTTEMPFLAHTRQVDMLNKENAEINPKGWFSVVIGNRLPQKGYNNHVFLISMEGHEKTLNQPQAEKSVRLIVLNHWSFWAEGYTFTDIVKQLSESLDGFRIKSNDISSSTIKNEGIIKALEHGYTPINHQWRNGSKTVSWYRGPFVPADVTTAPKYVYTSADKALRFDSSTGMFDISYSSAWQLGRLLALQNPRFSTALSNWKTDYEREKPLRIAREILSDKKNGIEIKPEQISDFSHLAESDEILTDLLMEFWNT